MRKRGGDHEGEGTCPMSFTEWPRTLEHCLGCILHLSEPFFLWPSSHFHLYSPLLDKPLLSQRQPGFVFLTPLGCLPIKDKFNSRIWECPEQLKDSEGSQESSHGSLRHPQLTGSCLASVSKVAKPWQCWLGWQELRPQDGRLSCLGQANASLKHSFAGSSLRVVPAAWEDREGSGTTKKAVQFHKEIWLQRVKWWSVSSGASKFSLPGTPLLPALAGLEDLAWCVQPPVWEMPPLQLLFRNYNQDFAGCYNILSH